MSLTNRKRRPANRNTAFHAAAEGRAQLKRQRAVELRLSGKSFREIGRELGVSHVQAQNYLAAWAAEEQERSSERIALLQAIEHARLEQIIARWWPIATADELRIESEVSDGRGGMRTISIPTYEAGTKAAAIVIKASESLRTLFGLDAPQKKELTGANGAPLIPAVSPGIEAALVAGYQSIVQQAGHTNGRR